MISRTSTAGVLCAATLFLLAGCSPDGAATGDGELDTEDARASYGIGYNVGSGLAPLADRVDNAAFERGFRDALAEADPAIPEDSLQQALMSFQLELQQSQQAAMAAEAETNQAAADSFMAEVRERDGVTTTESGLAYEVVEPGDGSTPSAEDEVTLHYHGTLVDGTTFDSSRDRGQPATFSLQNVIPGFAEGIQLMPVGSTYRLFIPPDLGYGSQGQGPISPGSVLVFEVELLGIE